MESPAAQPASTLSSQPTARPPVRLIFALSGLMSLGSLSTDMYLPALPTIGAAYGVSVATVQLTLTTFLIGFCGGQLIWGPIGDRFGRRAPAVIGLALFAAGSIGCALSGSIGQMTAWRTFQAFGAAAGPVLARAMVRDLFARNQAARMLSMLILVMGIAPLLGPIMGGFVLTHWAWQGIFWIQAGLGAAGVASLLSITETLRLENRSRLRPTEMLISYMQLMQQRRLLGYGLTSGCYYGAVYAYLAGSPFVYINLYQVPAQLYGWLFGLNICGLMAMNAINGRLVMTIGSDRMMRYGTACVAIAGLVLMVDARTGFGGLAGLVAPLFVVISMNGAVVANSVAGALQSFPRKAGAASAVVGAMQFGIGVLTSGMTGWFADGTAFTFAWIIGGMGLGGVLANLVLLKGPAETKTI